MRGPARLFLILLIAAAGGCAADPHAVPPSDRLDILTTGQPLAEPQRTGDTDLGRPVGPNLAPPPNADLVIAFAYPFSDGWSPTMVTGSAGAVNVAAGVDTVCAVFLEALASPQCSAPNEDGSFPDLLLPATPPTTVVVWTLGEGLLGGPAESGIRETPMIVWKLCRSPEAPCWCRMFQFPENPAAAP
jgi:hypothetical protein